MTFEQLRDERYGHVPFDLASNPRGFPGRRPGDSDISAHLPFIEYIASKCKVCAELGVRDGYSTVALLTGAQEKVFSLDIQRSNFVNQLMSVQPWPLKASWNFFQADTYYAGSVLHYLGEDRIKQIEFLFVDTLHIYEQVKAELSIFGPYIHRFIGFHDTYSQGEQSLDCPGGCGINKAIEEFLAANPDWRTVYKVDFNHGLWLIEKSQ